MTNIPFRDDRHLVSGWLSSRGMDEAQTHQLFSALGEQLAVRGERVELVIIGGSALLALGLTSRATRDVDIVALLADRALAKPRPLPPGADRGARPGRARLRPARGLA